MHFYRKLSERISNTPVDINYSIELSCSTSLTFMCNQAAKKALVIHMDVLGNVT